MGVGRWAGDIWQRIGKNGLLSEVAKTAVPNTWSGAAADYLPDIAMAGLYAASLPADYAGMPEKLGVGLEDATLGIGGSMLARALTGGVGLKMGLKRDRIDQMTGFAGMIGGTVAQVAAPRLYGGYLQKRADEEFQKLQKQREEGLIAQGVDMAGGGFAESRPVQGLDYLLSGFNQNYGAS